MQTKTVFPLVAVFVTVIMLNIPPAFAEPTANVSAPEGTSAPGCEVTADKCFIPYEVTVDVGGEVTWSNDDSAAHTVTSGTAADGTDGVFDSGLFMAGTTFSHKFEEAGTYNYFCMVHPWMEGIVIVKDVEASSMMEDKMMDINQIMAEIQTGDGMINEPMTIDLTMTDLDGNGIELSSTSLTITIPSIHG